MPKHQFDRSTYNQLRADLIHIQSDLMTDVERQSKLSHVVDFVKSYHPKIASLSNQDLVLSFLNSLLSVPNEAIVSSYAARVGKIKQASKMSVDQKKEAILKVASELEEVYGHDKVALENILKKVFNKFKDRADKSKETKVEQIISSIQKSVNASLAGMFGRGSLIKLDDSRIEALQKKLENIDDAKAAGIRVVLGKTEDLANRVNAILSGTGPMSEEDRNELISALNQLKASGFAETFVRYAEAQLKDEAEEQEAGEPENISAAEQPAAPSQDEEPKAQSQEEEPEADEPLRFLRLLRGGKTPPQQMFDSIVDVDSFSVSYQYLKGNKRSTDTLKRATVSVSIGQFIKKNLNNLGSVAKLLSVPQVKEILGVNGLANQTRFAFKDNKTLFLDLYEDMGRRESIFTQKSTMLCFSLLFKEELNEGTRKAYKFISELEDEKYPLSVGALVDICRKSYPDDIRLWDRLEPAQEDAVETKPVQEPVAEKTMPKKPDVTSMTDAQLQELSKAVSSELKKRKPATVTTKAKSTK